LQLDIAETCYGLTLYINTVSDIKLARKENEKTEPVPHRYYVNKWAKKSLLIPRLILTIKMAHSWGGTNPTIEILFHFTSIN